MQTVSIREIRKLLTRLEEILRLKGELHITRRGQAIARIIPMLPHHKVPSRQALRDSMPTVDRSSEELIRTDREGR